MTTALYRRYRPETFAEVIGQEHVTGPLMQALRSGRVSHAYLFSGPRGCGKTTSARILARTLNCARNTPENPLDTPCGECPSCVELARGGPGSLDVVEIDAASHGGVDDARDLRERATFAPTRDRYKIFIIDEAHMVSPAGFNALLKIVEEPPPHIKFVFATTEPDKVIGTIRSRTHHYPFRLVPPDVLSPYLEQLCAAEGVTLGAGVVPLVVRAGGGSVRDTLSVLDQLIAGASGGVVGYDLAVGLLGYTHASLLDDVVDALAARDGASLFRVVDQLIASGHPPQRFVDDLLERLRDLIVIAVSGDSAAAVLRDLPADQLERMRTQAQRLGVAELSRAADLVNTALTEMTGATSPRLHLELLCARLLLPGSDEGTAGLAARVERLERGGLAARVAGAAAGDTDDSGAAGGGALSGGAAAGGALSGAAAARAALRTSRQPAAAEPAAAESAGGSTPAAARASTTAPAAGAAQASTAPAAGAAQASTAPPTAGVAQAAQAAQAATSATSAAGRPESASAPKPEPAPVPGPEPAATSASPVPAASASPVPAASASPVPAASAQSADAAPADAPGGVTAEVVRRRWDEIVTNLSSPVTRALVGQNAQVSALDGGVLRLGFTASGIAQNFGQPRHIKAVEEAVYQTLGVPVRVETVVEEGGARPREAGPARRATEDAPEGDDPADRPALPARNVPAAPPAGGPPRPGTTGATTVVDRPTPASPGDDATAAVRPTPPARRGASTAVADPPAPAAAPTAVTTAADEADAAWLAGVSLHEPPAEDEAEPPVDDPRPAAQQPTRSALAQSPPETAPAAPNASPHASSPQRPSAGPEDGPLHRETPLQAVQRHALQARGEDRNNRAAVDPYDDSSADDPEIAQSGLVGVPLVVKMLDGRVIDEQVDQA